MIVTTHLRIAAGVCVLSTGLMIGSAGGAVAAAETGSTGSASSAGDAPSSKAAANGPIKNLADTLRKQMQNSLQGVAGTLNSLPKPGEPGSFIPKSPKTTFGATPTVHGSTGSTTAAIAADPTPTVANPLVAVSTAASSAVAGASLAASNAAANASQAAANASQAASNVAAEASLAASNAASAATLAASDAITTAADAVEVPVTQVVTSVQDILTSVGNAGTAFSLLPADLSALLGVSAVPSATGQMDPSHLLLPSVLAGPVTTPGSVTSLPILALPGAQNLPATITPAGPMTPLDFAAQASREAKAAAAPAPAPNDGSANDVLSMVEHVIGAFVASVSLTALLAVALPGLGALLGTCAAGIRLGYRQAKAGAELPGTAMSRFVGSGPVGVVRSSSQIALRARPARTDDSNVQQPAPARRLRVVRAASASADLLDHAV
jgi:hypothetical protein